MPLLDFLSRVPRPRFGLDGPAHDDPHALASPGHDSRRPTAGRGPDVTLAPDVGDQPAHGVRGGDGPRSSEELLLSVARGDREACAALYERMAGLVHLNVCRILRDVQRSAAVTQEVFAAVRCHAGRFDPARGGAEAWVLTFAHGRAMERVHSAAARRDRTDQARAPRSRLERVLDALGRHADGELPDRLCSAAAEMLGATGVGISMVAGDAHLQTVWARGTGRAGEELHLTLGRGPAYDACRSGQPVLIEDLDATCPWPMFGRHARGSEIRAIFSFPLRSGAASLGAFTVYRDKPGPVDDGQYGDALVFARIALEMLLGVQSEQPVADVGDLFTVTGGGSDPWEVHHATGMVSAQLGISIRDALATLRGHAFSSGRSLSETAAEVVAGRIRLGDGGV